MRQRHRVLSGKNPLWGEASDWLPASLRASLDSASSVRLTSIALPTTAPPSLLPFGEQAKTAASGTGVRLRELVCPRRSLLSLPDAAKSLFTSLVPTSNCHQKEKKRHATREKRSGWHSAHSKARTVPPATLLAPVDLWGAHCACARTDARYLLAPKSSASGLLAFRLSLRRHAFPTRNLRL